MRLTTTSRIILCIAFAAVMLVLGFALNDDPSPFFIGFLLGSITAGLAAWLISWRGHHDR